MMLIISAFRPNSPGRFANSPRAVGGVLFFFDAVAYDAQRAKPPFTSFDESPANVAECLLMKGFGARVYINTRPFAY